MDSTISSVASQGVVTTQLDRVNNDQTTQVTTPEQETPPPPPPPAESGRGTSVDTSA